MQPTSAMMDMIDEIIHLHIPPTSNQLIVSSPTTTTRSLNNKRETERRAGGTMPALIHSFIHSFKWCYILIKRVQLAQIVFACVKF